MTKLDPLMALHAMVEARAYLWRYRMFDDLSEVVQPLYAFAREHKLKLSFDEIDNLLLQALWKHDSGRLQNSDH